jgi:CRISPR-associated protein Csb2
MALAIKLTFVGGRFHATPWGRHVNEGVPEWPPSPWRFLRALIAVWRRTRPDLSEAQVKDVLKRLVAPPHFQLPPHRVAHTRQFVPWEKTGPDNRTLVFDVFVVLGKEDAVFLGWPDVDLRDPGRTVLKCLLENLTSLGRAEAWVRAELHEAPVDWNCQPTSETEFDSVAVFCANPQTAFSSEHYPVLDPKKLTKGKVQSKDYLFDCPRWHLCLDTETIHAQRWSLVPGATWVPYSRPVETNGRTCRARPVSHTRPTILRFLLDGPVLPNVTETVRVAEAFRNAAMGSFRRWCERHPDQSQSFLRMTPKGPQYASQNLAGKDLTGRPLAGHNHAHYLAASSPPSPRQITHLIAYAPAGFEALEVTALQSMRWLRYPDRDSTDWRLQLVGLGAPGDFTSPLFTISRVWRSATPFVAHRFMKRRGRKSDLARIDGPHDRFGFARLCLEEILRRRGFPHADVLLVEPFAGRPQARDFRRSRTGEDGLRRAFGWFEVTFESPVEGPLCLGYGSHYGLGLFEAVPAQPST